MPAELVARKAAIRSAFRTRGEAPANVPAGPPRHPRQRPELHQSTADPQTWFLIERFATEASFARHMASDYFARFRARAASAAGRTGDCAFPSRAAVNGALTFRGTPVRCAGRGSRARPSPGRSQAAQQPRQPGARPASKRARRPERS
ncbi:MAG: hypothetical protein E6I00_07200 [Chloroflexi bacterium]|nr:MAG: hypothetical protein E6I00_07200 [Chloroflexota bacterium]